jgi:STE24 endopeptidase
MSEMTAMRMRWRFGRWGRLATIALLAAAWLACAAWLWRTQVPSNLRLPRLDPHAYFSARELRRTARHDRFLDWDWVTATLAQLAALVVVARRPPRVPGRPLLRSMLLACAAVGAAWLVALPFAFVAHWWQLRYGIARQGYGAWFLMRLPGFGESLALAAVAALLLAWLARRLGRRWWLAGAPLVAVLGALVIALGALLAGGAPLRDRHLAAEIRRLARAEGVGRVHVEVERAHKRTRAANAEAVGIGPTSRIVLWDTLLDGRFSRPEVRFVAAHELAHLRRRHVWKGLAWFGLFALPGTYLLARVTERRGGLAEPRAIPLGVLVLFCLQLALLPAVNVISRRYEAEADWIALHTTNDPAAATDLFEGFAGVDVEQPSPPTWDYVLLEDHPTLLQRIAMARAYRLRRAGAR